MLSLIIVISLGLLFIFICSKMGCDHKSEYSIDLLTNLNIDAICSIDKINDLDVRSIPQPFIIYTNQLLYKNTLSGNNEKNLFLSVRGWAVDPVANNVAGGVIAEVNKMQYKAIYGLVPENATNYPGQPAKSGFRCLIPLSDITYFPRVLSIKVVNNDKTGYYVSPKTLTFVIMDEPLPSLKGINKLEQTTRNNLDSINGMPVSGGNAAVIDRASPLITISGWAVDSVEGYLAGGVYISIDSNDIPAVYGFERMDVAGSQDNLQYTFSGYQLNIRTDSLPDGPHTLAVKILKYNKKSYYTPDREYRFEIKPAEINTNNIPG